MGIIRIFKIINTPSENLEIDLFILPIYKAS